MPQWCAFLQDRALPVTSCSRALVDAVACEPAAALREFSRVLLTDPLLALHALRHAESRRSPILGHDTTTTIACALQLGLDDLVEIAHTSPPCHEDIPQLHACAFRSATAAHLAFAWASAYADRSPGEVALAALLTDMGELLLWHFAPEICQQLRDVEQLGNRPSGTAAQVGVSEFSLRGLSIALAQAWQLPPLLIQLMRNLGSPRALIAHAAARTARQLEVAPDAPAIAADIATLSGRLGVGLSTLLQPLPVSPALRQSLCEGIRASQAGDALDAAA